MITVDDLISKLEHDDKNKVDLYPLIEEINYDCTSEDVAGTYDRLLWSSPTGKRTLKFRPNSRLMFCKNLLTKPAAATWITEDCNSGARLFNMDYLLSAYAMKHNKVLIRCRNMSAGTPGLPEDLEIRVVCRESFVKFDNTEFIKAMAIPMEEHSMEIGAVDLQEEKLVVTAFFDDSAAIIINNQNYRPGIMISNSETGHLNPTIDAIMFNTINNELIRWPIEGESLMSINKHNIQIASLSKQVEQIPTMAYEQITHMEKALKNLSGDIFKGDVTMHMFLMLQGAKVDPSKMLPEIAHHIAKLTNGGTKPTTKLNMVQAIAACANTHKSQKLAKLAGTMLTQETTWENSLTQLLGKYKVNKAMSNVSKSED